MGVSSGTISGERLVNFDMNVVGSNAGQAVSYTRATNSCTLVCHNVAHTGGPTGTTVMSATKVVGIRR